LYKDQIGDPDQAYPTLVKNVLPIGLVGFFAAVLFGAILSSFNSALNSSVTLFGFDLYKEHFNKNATEKDAVKAGKRFGIGLGVVAMFIAPMIANAPNGLFAWLQEVNGLYSIPILTIIVVGYATKYVPALSAKIGLASGVIIYGISQLLVQPKMAAKAVEQAKASGITDATELAKIETTAYPHYLHVMAILFVLNIIIMLAIGKWKPRDTPYKIEYSRSVEIHPWKYMVPVSIAIVVFVVAIYAYFAQYG